MSWEGQREETINIWSTATQPFRKMGKVWTEEYLNKRKKTVEKLYNFLIWNVYIF